MVKEIQNKHMFMVPRQFSTSLLKTMLPFSLLQGDDSFSITHPFCAFRFCVIIHVSASNQCNMPNGYKKGPYSPTVPFNELCYHLWDSLAPSVHTLLFNPVGHRQFCALPSECLAPWQHQQLNVSVRQVSSVVDMLGAQVTNWQHLSCHCWKPCTISACFHGITHTPYTLINWQCIFTGTTTSHTKNKTHFILRSLPWFQNTIHI